MSKLLAAVLLAGTAFASMPAQAEVVRIDQLSGTGDNVVFDSFNTITNVAVGSFNGQHSGTVEFSCLGGCVGFSGAANGNDIKITNTNNLGIQVFDTNHDTLGTTTQVFSLRGTGTATVSIFANDANGNPEAAQIFNLGALSLVGNDGFTFKAINGEIMTSLVLLDIGGLITEFEHYRIDAVPLVATPLPAPAVLFLSGIVGIGMLKRYSNRKRASLDIATA